MTAQKRPYSLVVRLRLLLWSMLLLPIFAGTAFFMFHSSRVLHRQAARDLNVTLSLERQFIEEWMSERVDDIERLADDPRILSLHGPARHSLLEAQLKNAPEFNGLAYVNAKGKIQTDTTSAPHLDVSDRPYFKAAQRGEPYTTDILKSRITGESVIVVSAPVKDARGAFQGLVFGTVSLDTLGVLLRTAEAKSPSRTRLLQNDGTLIAPLNQGASFHAGDELYDQAVARRDPPEVYRDQNGARTVGVYQWVHGGSWLLVAEQPEMEILSTHAWILGVPLAGATLVFLLIGPAALRLAGSLRAPLRRLEDHAKQIEAGNYDMACAFIDEPRAPEEVRKLNQAYCLMVDRVRSALEELRQASFTDNLTGAANRSSLFHEGPRLLDAAQRSGKPVSALMLDLDHFKRVNDTYGHAAGDAVLAAFAAVLHSTLRKSDFFARYGGEEFVVLAPNAGPEAARELAERIRQATEKLVVPGEEANVRFTVSIGAATLEQSSETATSGREPLEELLAKADEAMYIAKSSGRNRVASLPPVQAGVKRQG